MNAKLEWLMQNRRDGEEYTGLILGKNGEPDYHLFLLPGDVSGVTFAQAKGFAKKAGGDLPTRREQSLLFANLKEHFQPAWYWSGERYVSDARFAWGQTFYGGNQGCSLTASRGRARVVRRVTI